MDNPSEIPIPVEELQALAEVWGKLRDAYLVRDNDVLGIRVMPILARLEAATGGPV